MKIVWSEILWQPDFDVEPMLLVIPESVPKLDDFRFKQVGPIYIAEKDSFVRVYDASIKLSSEVVSLTLRNGMEKDVCASPIIRPGLVNKLNLGYNVVEVSLGQTSSGFITVQKALEITTTHDCWLVRVEETNGEFYWVPSTSPHKVTKPSKEEVK